MLEWSTSGDTLFTACTHNYATDVWRLRLDANHDLRAAEPITNGTGQALPIALSSDGRQLAFTARNVHLRVWAFPFDAVTGKIAGTGRPITDSENIVFQSSLSRDGQRLLYRSGVMESMPSIRGLRISMPD